MSHGIDCSQTWEWLWWLHKTFTMNSLFILLFLPVQQYRMVSILFLEVYPGKCLFFLFLCSSLCYTNRITQRSCDPCSACWEWRDDILMACCLTSVHCHITKDGHMQRWRKWRCCSTTQSSDGDAITKHRCISRHTLVMPAAFSTETKQIMTNC